MKGPRGRRGLSLTETIMASFVLLSVFAITATMINSALRYSVMVNQQLAANHLARETLEQVRRAGTSYATWATMETLYTPLTITQDPYTLHITVQAPVSLASPCKSLESVFPVANQKLLTASVKPVQVDVTWGVGSLVRLNSLLSEPLRSLASPAVVVNGTIPPLLAKDGTVTLGATLVDSNNQSVPDVFFNWYMQPLSGQGTVTTNTRSGATANFTHHVQEMGMGTWGYAPGTGPGYANPSTCQVQAGTLYWGQPVYGNSSVVNLAP